MNETNIFEDVVLTGQEAEYLDELVSDLAGGNSGQALVCICIF